MKSLSATWTDSKVLNVEYINLSDPKDDEVQIKVGSAGICGSDLHYIRGDKPVTVGSIPGHEIGGFVSAVGKNVKHLKEGDLVGIEPVVRCGVCRFCITGAYQVCGARDVAADYRDGGGTRYRRFKDHEKLRYRHSREYVCRSGGGDWQSQLLQMKLREHTILQ